jgi:hypothetical protein
LHFHKGGWQGEVGITTIYMNYILDNQTQSASDLTYTNNGCGLVETDYA